MTQEHKNECCDGCGSSEPLQNMFGSEFCEECYTMATTVQKKPATVKRICELIKSDHTKESCDSSLKELPEVLDAVRHRTRDRELNTWYVSVSELKGKPVEIFASTAFDRDDQLQSRISNLTTITRLISLILRHVFLGEVLTLQKTIKQLHRSSRQKNDLPDMLNKVLQGYTKDNFLKK